MKRHASFLDRCQQLGMINGIDVDVNGGEPTFTVEIDRNEAKTDDSIKMVDIVGDSRRTRFRNALRTLWSVTVPLSMRA